MTEVTVHSIAYIAMQTRLALSSDAAYTAGGRGTFDYSQFYYDLVELLENPIMEAHTKKLLESWNMRIFPSETRRKKAVHQSAGGTASLILQQALRDSTNTA